jgi:hypothetical protein
MDSVFSSQSSILRIPLFLHVISKKALLHVLSRVPVTMIFIADLVQLISCNRIVFNINSLIINRIALSLQACVPGACNRQADV